MATNAKTPIGTRVGTGHICPESGIGKVVAYPTTTASIAKGNVMPPYGGRSATWELIAYA